MLHIPLGKLAFLENSLNRLNLKVTALVRFVHDLITDAILQEGTKAPEITVDPPPEETGLMLKALVKRLQRSDHAFAQFQVTKEKIFQEKKIQRI